MGGAVATGALVTAAGSSATPVPWRQSSDRPPHRGCGTPCAAAAGSRGIWGVRGAPAAAAASPCGSGDTPAAPSLSPAQHPESWGPPTRTRVPRSGAGELSGCTRCWGPTPRCQSPQEPALVAAVTWGQAALHKGRELLCAGVTKPEWGPGPIGSRPRQGQAAPPPRGQS